MLIVSNEIKIPSQELDISFVRSSGPGGQNVNKVNSKAVLRWNIAQSPSIGEGVRARFLASYGSRITTDGFIVLMSDRYRDQAKNREDCLDKLREMLLGVARPPKTRKKTKPTRGSIERRKGRKKQHAEKKRSRARVVH